MTVTAEQATAELRRRAAIKELQRRNMPALASKSTTGESGASTGISVGPLEAGEGPTFVDVEKSEAQKEWLRKMIESGRIKPEPKTFGQKFKQELPQMGGGAAGGLAGAKLGARFGPWGVLGGGVIGAGIGGMGGKGYEQMYRIAKGKPMTLAEIYKEQGIAGAEEAISELAGAGIAKVGGKMLRPLKQKLIPSAPRLGQRLAAAGQRIPAEEIAEITPYARRLLQKKGVFLTAAQLTESRGMDFVESATESTIFGGNRLFQIKKILQPKAYKQAVKELSDEFWTRAGQKLSPEEVGQLFIDTVTGKREIQRRLERIAYGQVDQMMKGTPGLEGAIGVRVDLRPVKAKALKILAQAEKSKGLGSASGIKRLATRVSKWDDMTETFMDAHGMRSNLLEEVRKLEGVLSAKLPKVQRAADTLAIYTDRAMERAARGYSDEAYTAWRAANKLVREGREQFNDEALKSALRVAKKRPDLVAKSLFIPNGAQRLAQVKQGLTPDTYKSLLASFMDTTMQKSKNADGILLGKSFKKAINELGSEMHIQMFDSMDHLRNVLDIANLGEIIQAPTGGGGGMIAQLTQAGAIIDLAVGLPTGKPIKAASGLILVGPALLGRLMSTPSGAKWFAEGITNPSAAKHVPAQVLRLLRAAYTAQQSQKEPQSEYYRGYGGRGV